MVSELNFSKRDKALIAVGLVVIAVLLVVLLVIVRGVSRKQDQAKILAIPSSTASASLQVQPSISSTSTSASKETRTITPKTTPTPGATEDPNKDLNSAKAVVTNFLNGYIARDLAQSKSYMTDGFYNSFDQNGFAGPSSPSRDRSEIVSAEVKQAGSVYGVKAYLYLQLNGADSGTNVLVFDVVRDGTRFLVSGMKESEI